MPPFAQATVAAALFLVLHISTMAFCAQRLGVAVQSVTYGVGPTLFRRGRFRFKAFPLAGSVKLKDSREEPLELDQTADAFNHQPVWKQVLIPLTGVGSTLLLSLLILGANGWASFVSAFGQILEGAAAPLSVAQTNLFAFEKFAAQNSFALVFGLVATKLVAYNLLPFGGFNGGQALMNLVKWGRPHAGWEEPVGRWLLVPALVLFVSWTVALVVHVLP
jgi:membrane-associated protease RseP (regulator of RpoE activity)